MTERPCCRPQLSITWAGGGAGRLDRAARVHRGELSPAGRAGTPDEIGNVGALLMGPDGAFITGSDFLMDGGVTASYFFGELAPH